jgi:large subunit ribosomal protein L13e
MMKARSKVFKQDGKQRYGKGFSVDELRKAGSSLSEAVKFGVPVDARRKTAHEVNVEAVKAFLVERKTALKHKKPKGKSKS